MLPRTLKCVLILLFAKTILSKEVPTRYRRKNYERTLDKDLNFTQLAEKYGHPAEEYKVTTEDGYILTVHHLPGIGPPVFLQHGLLDSSVSFLLRGDTSLAVTLAEENYDVWLGNTRGNKYSRKHVSFDPDRDKQFWNFSMDDLVNYDLPAMIDFVLLKTDATQLAVIGHSQGTAIFFALAASKLEYNDKINVMIALAPICFLHHAKTPFNEIIKLGPVLNEILLSFGFEEVLSDYSDFKLLMNLICTQFLLTKKCVKGILYFAGYDSSEFDEEFFVNVMIGHYPTSTSRTNLLHLNQIALSKRFQSFDFGKTNNRKVYGMPYPPEYDLSKVTMHVELLQGRNDKLSTIPDVAILQKNLPNANITILKNKLMNHLDFVWGKHMSDYLFPDIKRILHKYS